MPEAKFVREKVLNTRARNTGNVHEIDAIAYETPNRKTEPSVRLRPPLSRRGVENGKW